MPTPRGPRRHGHFRSSTGRGKHRPRTGPACKRRYFGIKLYFGLAFDGEVLYVIEIKAEAATTVGSEPDPRTSRESPFRAAGLRRDHRKRDRRMPLTPILSAERTRLSAQQVTSPSSGSSSTMATRMGRIPGTATHMRVCSSMAGCSPAAPSNSSGSTPPPCPSRKKNWFTRVSLQVYAGDIYGRGKLPGRPTWTRTTISWILRDAGGKVLVFDFRTQERQMVPEDASKD